MKSTTPVTKMPHSEVGPTLKVLEDLGVSGMRFGSMRTNISTAVRVAIELQQNRISDLDCRPNDARFIEPARQILNLLQWNKKHQWNLDPIQVLRMLDSVPAWPWRSHAAVVLVPYFDTVGETFDRLWMVAARQQRKHIRWVGVDSDASRLRLLEGVEHRPGLRWEVIDLAANWDYEEGVDPYSVRSAASSPHAGILEAAAHFPKWVRAMDGDMVPCVWLPGYEATCLANVEWSHTPELIFHRDAGIIKLGAQHSDASTPRIAVPAFWVLG